MSELAEQDYDLIVVGTGLVETIIASAAAVAGKRVLHLDPSEHYGGPWASLPLQQFLQELQTARGAPYNAEVVVKRPVEGWAAACESSAAAAAAAAGDVEEKGQRAVDAGEATADEAVGYGGTRALPAAEAAEGVHETQDSDAQGEAVVLPIDPLTPVVEVSSALAAATSTVAGGGGGGVVGSAADGVGNATVGNEGGTGGWVARYSDVEVYCSPGADLGAVREYSIDLAHKAVYCTGRFIDLLVASGVHKYLEFKLLASSYIYSRASGKLLPVPASRSDIFQNKTLGPLDKRALMRFIKACTDGTLEAEVQGQAACQPFCDLLQRHGLTNAGLQDYVLYAIALAGSAQPLAGSSPPAVPSVPGDAAGGDAGDGAVEGAAASAPGSDPHAQASSSGSSMGEAGVQGAVSNAGAAGGASGDGAQMTGVLTVAQGLARLGQYMESVGRYGHSSSPFITTLYGVGELPQAFCRLAAVKGAIYVLRRGVASFVVEDLPPQGGAQAAEPAHQAAAQQQQGLQQGLGCSAGGARCVGVRTCTGQLLRCGALAGSAALLQPLLQYCGTAPAPTVSTTAASPAAAAGLLRGPQQQRQQHRSRAVAEQRQRAVCRAVAVLDGPVVPAAAAPAAAVAASGEGMCLLVFPPGSLPGQEQEQVVVQGVLVGWPASVAPRGRHLLYLTATWDTPAGSSSSGNSSSSRSAKEVLLPALAAVARLPQDLAQHAAAAGSSSSTVSGEASDTRPAVLQAVFYVDHGDLAAMPGVALPAAIASSSIASSSSSGACSVLPCPPNVVICPGPSPALDLEDAADSAAALFARLYPDCPCLFAPPEEARAAAATGAAAAEGGAAAGAGEGEDSDEELLGALQAALAGLETGGTADSNSSGSAVRAAATQQ